MKTTMKMDVSEFLRNCNEAAIKVEGTGTSVMETAVRNLREDSLSQVPIDTGTLAGSVFAEVKKEGRRIEGTVGYGQGDPVNPSNKQATSQYMVKVHEDLNAYHPRGKAKFLEDPAREASAKLGEEYGKEVDLIMKAIFRGK